MNNMKDTKICVIGLGYVGLPLARLFSTKFETVEYFICFDIRHRSSYRWSPDAVSVA